jgi:hypothetical protein
MNIVRDYNVFQGTVHPSDNQIIRDYNIRYITIENSSAKPVGIAISEDQYSHPVGINLSLAGGEIRHLGINSIGSPMQYIHIIDLSNKTSLGTPSPFRTDGNQFVLRETVGDRWFVQVFKRPSYRAAF